MFGRRKKHRPKATRDDDENTGLLAELGLGANLDDPYHLAHWRFAF